MLIDDGNAFDMANLCFKV